MAPAASEDTIIGFLGQSVTLPCQYPSWSQSRNSMCWGKGACPNSKCNAEILHTDGMRVISRKSIKYTLLGNIRSGDLSLTISNANQGDSGVYCCRIEVPGWFNDVRKTVRLELRRATTTKKPTTTTQSTTTPYVTTTPELLPTTVMATPLPTTTAPARIVATTAFSTAVTTHPSTTPGSFSQETTRFPTTEIFTKVSAITAVIRNSECIQSLSKKHDDHIYRHNLTQTHRVQGSASPINFTADDTENNQALMTVNFSEKGARSHQINNRQTNILIIACCVGFVLMVLLFLAFLLQGKVTEANCLPRHKRPDSTEDSKNVLSDMTHGRDDEDGIFTL
ncbi:T-cell immunoglobulin and mucin domain-containing protein 4 [Apodemus speciosus]